MSKLITLLRKIILSPLIGMRWVNALESAAKEDYIAASQLLARVDEFYEGRNIECHLPRAYVGLRLGTPENAVSDCITANRLLDGSSRYNDEEKKYLRCYASKVANWAITSMPKENRPEEVDNAVCDGIQYQRVRQALRLSFPVTESKWIREDTN